MATKTTLTDSLKKYFYSGIGLASHTGEIVQHSVDELVKKGKLNQEDGKRIVDNALRKLESKMPHFEAGYQEAIRKAMKFANAEISMLQKKIASYEKRNGNGVAKKTSAPAARKVSAKKSSARKTVRRTGKAKKAAAI